MERRDFMTGERLDQTRHLVSQRIKEMIEAVRAEPSTDLCIEIICDILDELNGARR